MKSRIALTFTMLVMMAACSSQIAENPCKDRGQVRDLGEVWDDERQEYVQIVEFIEHPPTIIGGLEEVRKHLVYPEMAIRVGAEGTVTVMAYVNSRGEVTETEIIDSLGFGCSEAAAYAVSLVKFEPGCQRGKPVNFKISVPVKFRLN